MKSPFWFNIIWLSIIAIPLGVIILGPCLYPNYCFTIPPRTENILLGVLSSTILLVFIEVINQVVDRWKYGFLKKAYKKKMITQVNSGRISGSSIENRAQKESEGVKYYDDSVYHELLYYKCDEVSYLTELKYHYHGIYTGTVEYMDHPNSDWRNGKITKTKSLITLNLNLANKMTGSGSYKYFNRDDFGKFEFQVDEQDNRRIIVYYVNTIPSGLAEGYEIWESTS